MTADEVKAALKTSGLTLREMGIRLGVAQETVWRWTKKGCPKRVFSKRLEAIARAKEEGAA